MNNEELVEKLANLSSEELEEVLESLRNRLEQNNTLKKADDIIERYKPALKELAK